MNILNEINGLVHSMTKNAQAPGFVPSMSYYKGMRGAVDSIPQRYKDHALNTAVAGQNGWWRFWNNVVPNTPVYLSQLAGATLGGIKGAFSGPRKGSELIDEISSNPEYLFHAPARIAKALHLPAINDMIQEGYKGYDSFGEIARNKWQKPARKAQDKVYPFLKKLDSESGMMLDQLEEIRREQAANGNAEAMEDFEAAKKLKHLVPFTVGSAVLGKTTNGFGTIGNSR